MAEAAFAPGIAMTYLVLFLASVAVDIIPFVAPPVWAVMIFFLVKFDLNPWLVLLVGVPGSTLGRYLFGLYVVKSSKKHIKQHTQEELEYLGKRLGQKPWPSWLFVFGYTLTPLSTTALFTAAGMARVKPMRILPPFFCGKLLSDAVMIFTGRYAVGNLQEGVFSVKGIVFILLGLVIVGAFLFIDWRTLLQKKKLTFHFRIWK